MNALLNQLDIAHRQLDLDMLDKARKRTEEYILSGELRTTKDEVRQVAIELIIVFEAQIKTSIELKRNVPRVVAQDEIISTDVRLGEIIVPRQVTALPSNAIELVRLANNREFVARFYLMADDRFLLSNNPNEITLAIEEAIKNSDYRGAVTSRDRFILAAICDIARINRKKYLEVREAALTERKTAWLNSSYKPQGGSEFTFIQYLLNTPQDRASNSSLIRAYIESNFSKADQSDAYGIYNAFEQRVLNRRRTSFLN